MIDEGRAVPHWNRGVFCIRLRDEPSGRDTPETACGIDTGSKAEGMTVKSNRSTYLHVQSEARSGIQAKVEKRREFRSQRRRSSPYRSPDRYDHSSDTLPPSTKARWHFKVRLCDWLLEMYPIDIFVVENIQHPHLDGFNPLKRGKTYFFNELKQRGRLSVIDPYQLSEWRDEIEMEKSYKNKTNVGFRKHCIDSWTLAWLVTNCPFDTEPDWTEVLHVVPIETERRVLPIKHARSSCQTDHPLTRGALVEHDRYGLVYIGDHPIHPPYGAIRDLETDEVIDRSIDPDRCTFKRYISWRFEHNQSKPYSKSNSRVYRPD